MGVADEGGGLRLIGQGGEVWALWSLSQLSCGLSLLVREFLAPLSAVGYRRWRGNWMRLIKNRHKAMFKLVKREKTRCSSHPVFDFPIFLPKTKIESSTDIAPFPFFETQRFRLQSSKKKFFFEVNLIFKELSFANLSLKPAI